MAKETENVVQCNYYKDCSKNIKKYIGTILFMSINSSNVDEIYQI